MGLSLNQFKLGDFVVDTNRCQIQEEDDITSIEPKVMDILCYLSKHPGKVVSQEDLFSAVWPNAIYNPSSIQRCIALLRKAFREDAKNPKIIITHPKRGYRLELPVEYLPISHSSSNKPVKDNKLRNRIVLLASLVSFSFVAYLLINMNPDIVIKEQYSELIPVVSTGKNELHPRFSPDGQYLAYIAHVTDEKYHIWVKNLKNSQVSRLSKRPSNLVSINWTSDQQAIGFVERESEGDRIGRLPFNRFQSEPVAAQIILSLKNKYIISQLQWTKNGEVIYVSRDKDQHASVMRYDIESKIKKPLPGLEQVNDIFDIALSNDNNVLAIVNDGKQNRYPISLIDLNTGKLTTLVVLNGNIYGINWHPADRSLLVSNREKLKLIDLSGNIKDLNFTNYLNIANANYSPDGNKITMTLISMDFDILTSSVINSSKNKRVVDSNSIDMQPLFSPNSNQFAFVSMRSGSQQVFIYENGIERLLFENADNEEFFGMAWSPDGRRLAISLAETLYIIGAANGDIVRSFKPGGSSMYLRGWYHRENALLVNLPGPIPAKFNLDSLTTTRLSEKISHCAALDLNDNVYLNLKSKILKLSNSAEESVFWQVKEGEIDHLYVGDQGLTVELKTQQTKQLLKIDFDQETPVKYLPYEESDIWLSDVSSDGKQLLSMTRSNVNRTIFTLQ